MSTELYIIAHKVRGEPAFDVAIQYEGGWLIPTSGHRARPYWSIALDNDDLSCNVPPMPQDWPDHYSCNDRKPTQELTLENLGL